MSIRNVTNQMKSIVLDKDLIKEVLRFNKDTSEWNLIFELYVLEYIDLENIYSFPIRTRLAIACIIIGSQRFEYYHCAFRLLCAWSSVGGCWWIIQEEILRHAAVAILMNQNQSNNIIINNIDIVLPPSQHLPKFINNEIIIKKIKCLRIKFKELIKKSNNLSKNDFKLIIVRYANKYPIDKFVLWMINWCVELLIKTESMYPSIKPPPQPPNDSILIHDKFKNKDQLVREEKQTNKYMSGAIESKKDDDESNEDYKDYEANGLNNGINKIYSLLKDNGLELIDKKIRKVNNLNSKSSSRQQKLIFYKKTHISCNIQDSDNVVYINNNSIDSNTLQVINNTKTNQDINEIDNYKNINIVENKIYEEDDENKNYNINNIEAMDFNEDNNNNNNLQKRKHIEILDNKNKDNTTNQNILQNNENNNEKGFFGHFFDYISFENENENDYFL